MERAFWDVVAVVDSGSGETYDAILGGLSIFLKLKLIFFPRWTRTNGGNMIYPFVNGKRQFNLQYRKYDRKYDSYLFLMKEFLALLCYFILKPYWDHKKLWLVGEKYCTMAQDNGFYFFRYCMEQVPEEQRKKILYVIDKNSPDYQAVKEYEPNVIQFMSFKYMIYLSAAQYLISTDAIRHFYIWDSPISVYKLQYQARKNIIFLQHGVTAFKQCHKTYRKNCGNQMALFVVTSEPEQKIIEKYFGYDKEEVIVTGFSRWDVLEDRSDPAHKEILLMPTWRNWLEDISEEAFRKRILSAVKHNKWVDYLIRFLSFIGNSMPNFFAAMVLMYFLSIRLGVLPVVTNTDLGQSIILPTLTLAISMAAKYTRQVRATVLEELNKDYVTGARARGIRSRVIIWKNVMKASMLTIITLLALSIGNLLGGTAIVENIFMWDGVGKLAVDAITMRDYPIIQAYVAWMAVIYVLVNLVTDIIYHYLDPRVRLGGDRA